MRSLSETTKATIRTYCAVVSVVIQIVVGIVVIYFDRISLAHK